MSGLSHLLARAHDAPRSLGPSRSAEAAATEKDAAEGPAHDASLGGGCDTVTASSGSSSLSSLYGPPDNARSQSGRGRGGGPVDLDDSVSTALASAFSSSSSADSDAPSLARPVDDDVEDDDIADDLDGDGGVLIGSETHEPSELGVPLRLLAIGGAAARGEGGNDHDADADDDEDAEDDYATAAECCDMGIVDGNDEDNENGGSGGDLVRCRILPHPIMVGALGTFDNNFDDEDEHDAEIEHDERHRDDEQQPQHIVGANEMGTTPPPLPLELEDDHLARTLLIVTTTTGGGGGVEGDSDDDNGSTGTCSSLSASIVDRHADIEEAVAAAATAPSDAPAEDTRNRDADPLHPGAPAAPAMGPLSSHAAAGVAPPAPPPVAAVFRHPLALRQWETRNARVNDRIDAALEDFPRDVDVPYSFFEEEAGAQSSTSRRGDDGGCCGDGNLRAFYLSDATRRVRFENQRVMLRLRGELFDGAGDCGGRRKKSGATGSGPASVPRAPFFEVAIRRRRVRRAGSFDEGGETTQQRQRQQQRGGRKWATAYRSYPLPQTVRPRWDALDVGDLGRRGRGNDDDVPVRIDVYDSARRRSEHGGGRRRRLIGSFEATTKELTARGRSAAAVKSDEKDSAAETCDEGCGAVDFNDGDSPAAVFPLTRNGRRKGWVRVRAERTPSAAHDGAGDGGTGVAEAGADNVRLQLEMRLPRVRVDAGGATRSDTPDADAASAVAGKKSRRSLLPGGGPLRFRRRRPSPYFEVSIPEERVAGIEGADASGRGGSGADDEEEVLGDVSWDWCTIYRSYPVQAPPGGRSDALLRQRRRSPSWDPLEVILPPDAGRSSDAPVRVAVYDGAVKGGGSHVERCRRKSAIATAAKAAATTGEDGDTNGSGTPIALDAGFVGAFEARVQDLTQGEERRFALIRDGWQRGWMHLLSTERCDL